MRGAPGDDGGPVAQGAAGAGDALPLRGDRAAVRLPRHRVPAAAAPRPQPRRSRRPVPGGGRDAGPLRASFQFLRRRSAAEGGLQHQRGRPDRLPAHPEDGRHHLRPPPGPQHSAGAALRVPRRAEEVHLPPARQAGDVALLALLHRLELRAARRLDRADQLRALGGGQQEGGAAPALQRCIEITVKVGHIVFCRCSPSPRAPLRWCTGWNFYYITILRDPVSRYLSEWRHVQRGATWKASLHVCDGRSPTTEELPSCYTGDDWSGCSLQEFMDCPYNLANNRQVRMLSDLSLVGCYNLSVMPEEQRNKVLLDSAKENLKRMAFFGLTEFQRKTQYLFEKTFNMNFISPFTQYNSTRASSVEIDEQTQQRIEALNFLDMELYDYAKDLFLQRYQYMRQKEHQEARRKRQEQRKILRAKQAHLREQGENSSSTDYLGNVERWR
uniref:Heparan-sulfate 6-O-sulfotransferase n=3 Tax=Phasianidae TaxID=9005 RepID=A0A8V0Z284_CHICK